MARKLITAAAEEPVGLDQAKLHLRVDGDGDDTLITEKIVAARQSVEGFLNRALVTQTWELVLDTWPAGPVLVLPLPPLQSVTSITYMLRDGTTATLATSVYGVDADGEPGKVFLKPDRSWPADALYPYNAVRVRFVAGYGDASDVPAWARSALLLLLGDLYENREQTVIGAGLTAHALPTGVERLLWMHRIVPV